MSIAYHHLAFSLGYRTGEWLPRSGCRTTIGALAMAVYPFLQRERAALSANLARISGLEGAALEQLCRSNIYHFGQMLGDYFHVANADREAILSLSTQWQGVEHLRCGLERGKGVILVTAHLGNWELGGSLLALDGWPINVVTLPEPTPELTRMRDANRQRLGIRTIAVGNNDPFTFVEMVAALNRNEIVCMLVDRPYGETGAPVEFFGAPCPFSAAPALLWQHTGATVVPAFVLENGEGLYHAQTLAPVEFEAAEDRSTRLQKNTQRLATAFEDVIRQHPQQWYHYVPIWKHPR